MARFGVKEVADITLYSLDTNKPVLFLDTLKMTDITNKATTVYARGGKGNPRLLGWTFDREGTLSMQDALMNPNAVALLTGNSLVTKTTGQNIFKREVLTSVTSTTSGDASITLSHTPLSGTYTFYSSSDGYSQDKEVTPATQPTTSTVDFATTDVPVGSKVIAYYQYTSTEASEMMEVTSDAFPGYYKVIGDTVVTNESTGQDEAFQIVIPKAKLSADFTITLKPDGDPSVFDFNMDIFKDATTTTMIQLIRY